MLEQIHREINLIPHKWLKHIKEDGEWFCSIDTKGNGISRPTAPTDQGEEVSWVVDTRGMTPVLSTYTKILRELEDNQVDTNLENQHQSKPKPDTHIDFYLTVKACNPRYNEDKIDEFRKWLSQTAGHVPNHPELLICLPEQLVAFSKHLAQLRQIYAADSHLFGSVATSIDICLLIGKLSDEIGKTAIVRFNEYAVFLSSSEERHPVRILDAIIK